MQYTVTYYEGEDRGIVPPKAFHEIADAQIWCDHHGLPYSIFSITEWDTETRDAYGTPEITAMANLQFVIEDGATELSNYSNW